MKRRSREIACAHSVRLAGVRVLPKPASVCAGFFIRVCERQLVCAIVSDTQCQERSLGPLLQCLMPENLVVAVITLLTSNPQQESMCPPTPRMEPPKRPRQRQAKNSRKTQQRRKNFQRYAMNSSATQRLTLADRKGRLLLDQGLRQ